MLISIVNYILHHTFVEIGKLNGHFYDERGEPTANLRAAEKSIEEGRRLKANDAEHKKQYPPCNSEWKQATGLRVWCSNKR